MANFHICLNEKPNVRSISMKRCEEQEMRKSTGMRSMAMHLRRMNGSTEKSREYGIGLFC